MGLKCWGKKIRLDCVGNRFGSTMHDRTCSSWDGCAFGSTLIHDKGALER